MASIPDEARHLFENKDFAHVGTLNADGWPQVSAVWISADGDRVKVNTVRGLLKARNLERDGRVGISIVAQDNPYENLLIKGKVVEITTDGAEEHIGQLTRRYMDVESYPLRTAGEERVIVWIEPQRVKYDKY
jgi:PPOX class probable F420-dependent enzyme